MSLAARAKLIAALLLAALVAEVGFRLHLQAAGQLAVAGLERPLADFPLQLGGWVGKDRPPEADDFRYGDQSISRDYVDPQRQTAVSLWIVYSRTGEDRGHHPEVCMQVAGKPEDPSVRQTLSVDQDAPIQQYCFGWPGSRQWVFYWHYTLPPPAQPELTRVQRLYQRMHQRPASVTVEVFAPQRFDDDHGEAVRRFVTLVDEALAVHVGQGAVRGSQRLNVQITPNLEPGQQGAAR